ncbi:tRNA pseudouridine(13) synthase TruD [Psychrobium sp. 1_MG-2023]|uniref:tRNA pseudouridine(13) synthase TruD n=1 Tax=Psychrobium sp. 1_MG-2023 TaxID=3062624 RepID=UPI000C34612A|nr:tRNA pseudouridine(13) synthase TruD [Psychrobium sp. 1_MG-2023]MDP2562381.1 tRNA pseudouridine(13) synthase TruD [Psychrobium sp. 1_MG-2023]PKF55854.1 tRNA pseudouridine(13) synthase TruD [Alteromonadales bacterium alter-6D02]
MALPQWSYLHGQPSQKGVIRSQPSDFKVVENLGYEADGQGEHLFLLIEKTGLNTTYVAKLIARWAGVTSREVSYAGLKDRHGVTTQTFSVQLPGREAPEIRALESEQLKVLSVTRNSKKLRRGALKGNCFTLNIQGLNLDPALEKRLATIKECGVPNYFGEQRFGHQGGNIEAARVMFGGEKVKNRDKRSMYLSAARSYIFNNVVSERIQASLYQQPLAGDAFILFGSKAGFTPESLDNEIIDRFKQRDIILSAPMWGKGLSKAKDQALAFESSVVDNDAFLCQGLENAGLKQERRAILVWPQSLAWQESTDGVRISFSLPAGSYATSVLRELALISDASLSQEAK